MLLGRQWEFRLIIQLFLTIYISQSYPGHLKEHTGRACAAGQVGTVSKSKAFKSSPELPLARKIKDKDVKCNCLLLKEGKKKKAPPKQLD